MPQLPQAAVNHYRFLQRLNAATVAGVRQAWSRMGADFDASWRRVGPRVEAVTSAGQHGAARTADAYTDAVTAELGLDGESVGLVNARRFAGVASDGRPLGSMLYGSVVQARTAAANGASTEEALAVGGRWLDMAVQTAVADAGRASVGTAIVARPAITGYVRMVNPPSCSRCSILAGKFYKWNRGFLRHPQCDCTHIPASEDIAHDLTTSPTDYFRSLSAVEQDRTFTAAGAQAIREGADMSQVVNARRGVSVAGATTTGTTRRGLAGRRLSPGAARLMPETIYEQAATRDEAIALLRQHAYIV